MVLAGPKILSEADGDCVGIERVRGQSPVLLICEHASNALPAHFGDLGLPSEALASHIAWDPGALAVARGISEGLDATLVHQRFSRLIYDCNRPPSSPGAMPETSEIYAIPGNKELTAEERLARTDALYVPFHDAIRGLIRDRRARGQDSIIVTIHSFTPVYHGRERPVELGILHDEDSRFADLMLKAAAEAPLYRTERNQPYGPEDGVTHTLILHGLSNGLRNVMIEVRNDLIADDVGQGVMADYLTGLLQQSLDA
ncbi:MULTISPECIES: N-formylglutamate amidohydrolase [unclassified Rhizobium]|uniref:N-formylglutamate amidohydrolase n=1 Tax=unclassified Rhizobium TaxID=2613769 RepID=UPI001A9863A2|nr:MULTISPECIES: N-formylglutamate amidohydrolase [unclassified Rhizobium]MBX5157727.1 N-formylglutamate amidohydrolase [Rhizobium sp. NZLR8]MBX5165004.1 N-formylglutamate amidohydrolase [Rhizobium sp. NZLR4b]MBX5170138.1 N-formylglutamate amidohydrolase [Rhizobium sp. NZLR1b]MBX5184945.1 N-formylglutamate amidohydrolase [Rhizobium sp. NZLR5]MBX5194919.1 N-formylglutamate amidohydrolase [Rhizobium sp. NZLR10]